MPTDVKILSEDSAIEKLLKLSENLNRAKLRLHLLLVLDLAGV